MIAIVCKNRSVRNSEHLGFVNALSIIENDELVKATSQNVPDSKEIFIDKGYSEFIDKKFDKNELFVIEYHDAYDEDNSCAFQASAQTAKSLNSDLSITTIINVNQILDPNLPIELISKYKPVKNSALIFKVNESLIIAGPFDLTTNYNNESNYWETSFRRQENLRYISGLKENNIFKLDLDTLPELFKLQIEEENDFFLSYKLYEYLRPHAEQISFLDDPSLFRMMDVALENIEGEGALGRKKRRDLLTKLKSSSFLPEYYERIENLLTGHDDVNDKLQEIFEKNSRNKDVRQSTFFENETDLNELKKDLQLQQTENQKLFKENQELQNKIKSVEDPSNKEEKIKELEKHNEHLSAIIGEQKNIENLRGVKSELQNQIEDLKKQSDDKQNMLEGLNEKLASTNEKFRDKALDVLPFIEMLNSSTKSDFKNDFFPNPENVETDFEDIHGLFEIVKERIRNHSFVISDFKLLVILFYYLNGRFITFYGPPGTGKTSLARAFSNSMSGNYNYIYMYAVQKGWSSPNDVFGSKNIFLNKFEYKDAFFASLSKGNFNEKLEVWLSLIFDEATLSPIEHYLSDFFGRDFENNSDNPFEINIDNQKFIIPGNLKIMLTMNFDFSTESVSQRFLDRTPIITCNNDEDEEISVDNQFSIQNDKISLLTPLSKNKMFEINEKILKEDFNKERLERLNDLFETYKPPKNLKIHLNPRKNILLSKYLKFMSIFDEELYSNYDIIDEFIISSMLPKLSIDDLEALDHLKKYSELVRTSLPQTYDSIIRIIDKGKELDNYTFLGS